MPTSTPIIGSLALTRADLLPPHKRFKDSYSFEASIEEDTKIDPIETEVDMELGIGDGDDVKDHVKIDPRDVRDDTEGYEADTSVGDMVEVGIDPMSALIVEEEIVDPSGEDSFDSSGTRDGIVRSFEDMPIDLDDAVRDFYHHMSEVRIDRIEEFRQVRMDRDDTQGRLRRTMTITHSGTTPEAIEELVNRRMEEALAAHEATRAANALETKNQSQNGSDGDNGNGGNRNGRNENPDENGRGDRHKSQVKYATCTLLDSALTWWNSHKRTIETGAAFSMSQRKLMKLMTEVYCPRNEIQKMEIELWNLTMKNNDLTAYT
ncbi:putative reverse transcriptase domain-containing protein [Tanacetum coccineum]